MLGLATQLLEALKRGERRRGREVRELDLSYTESSLALERPIRTSGLLAGDRAPDASIRGAGGSLKRLFDLFKGPHWTLLGYEVERGLVPPRPRLHIHTFGTRGDLIDEYGNFSNAYAVESSVWVLVRPDGYVGAIVECDQIEALENYLYKFGRGVEDRARA